MQNRQAIGINKRPTAQGNSVRTLFQMVSSCFSSVIQKAEVFAESVESIKGISSCKTERVTWDASTIIWNTQSEKEIQNKIRSGRSGLQGNLYMSGKGTEKGNGL